MPRYGTERQLREILKTITHSARTPMAARKATERTPEKLAVSPMRRLFIEAQLKSTEQSLFPYARTRLKTEYRDNCTAALSFPCGTQELQRKYGNQQALFNLSKELITEHARRRVDLFFYLLTAYYNKGFTPTEGHTTLQHGRGRNTNRHDSITQACHSSLIPALVDELIYDTQQKSVLCGTHFMDSLNTTVELPVFVNDLDNALENACRDKSLEILCNVSRGVINPIQGTTSFLNLLGAFLNDLKHNSEIKREVPLVQRSFLRQHSYIAPSLIDLVIQGTLGTTFSKENLTVSEEYIQLLLRLTPTEKTLCATDDALKAQLYVKKFEELQHEILTAKSSLASHTI